MGLLAQIRKEWFGGVGGGGVGLMSIVWFLYITYTLLGVV